MSLWSSRWKRESKPRGYGPFFMVMGFILIMNFKMPTIVRILNYQHDKRNICEFECKKSLICLHFSFYEQLNCHSIELSL